MRSLSSVGLALSMVFGCLLLALLAELYYLLWCKKRLRSRSRSRSTTRPDLRNDYSTHGTRELLFIFCCNSSTIPSSSASPSSSSFANPKPMETSRNADNGFGNVVGPGIVPRFLFTIMEETVEEMESEDGMVSTKGKSLNDLFLNMESGATPPYLTPRASPSLFTPPLTPLLMESSNGRKQGNLSFFESSSDAEFNRLVRASSSPMSSSHSPSSSSSSPLSRFKFLRDAEEKLYKKKIMEIAEAE